jgi:hypothetical protein
MLRWWRRLVVSYAHASRSKNQAKKSIIAPSHNGAPYGQETVRREKVCVFSGCESRLATVVPASSSWSGEGGNADCFDSIFERMAGFNSRVLENGATGIDR